MAMWTKETEADWQRLAEEVMTGMKEWRLAHPKATFKEIETALDEKLAKVRARMLQDVALASRAADLRAGPGAGASRVSPMRPFLGAPRGGQEEPDHPLQPNHRAEPVLRPLPQLWHEGFPPWMRSCIYCLESSPLRWWRAWCGWGPGCPLSLDQP